jgi:hypothetical protein
MRQWLVDPFPLVFEATTKGAMPAPTASTRDGCVNPSAPGSDTGVCERGTVMTTITVLAALAAAPLLVGIVLAVALGGFMVVRFAPDLVRGLRAPRRMTAA